MIDKQKNQNIDWHLHSSEEALSSLEVDRETGLTSVQIDQRLQLFGPFLALL
jgi:hypothetical protein